MALIDEIRTKAAALLPTRNTEAIALKVSTGRTVIVPRPIGKGSVLEALGADRGAVVISNLKKLGANDPRCEVAYDMLGTASFDVGSPTTRQQIDEFAVTKITILSGQTLLTQAEAAALKGLAEQAAPVTEIEVRRACWSDDGKWMP